MDLDGFDPTEEDFLEAIPLSDSSSHGNSSDVTGENATKGATPSPMLDDPIVQATNKRLISTELVQIYHASMESSMVCFLSEENCPYNRGQVSLLYCRRTDRKVYRNKPPTYLQRIHHLEQVSQPLRGTKLTSGQKMVSAKALQLAIMAFACQWTHAAVWPPRSPTTSFSDAMIEDIGTSLGFERLLQQSLWHEAQRYVEASAYIDSFRSIFAQMLFSMVQQPSFLNDLEQEALETPAPSAISVAMRFSGSTTDPDGPFTPLTPNAKPEERMFRHKYLAQALRHLAQWKNRLSRWKNESTQGLAFQKAAQEMDGSFHLLWWFGVMCDTSVSVINDKPLVIPDHEVYTYTPSRSERAEDPSLAGPRLSTRRQRVGDRGSDRHAAPSISIWDVDLMPAQPFQALASDAESIIREACPSKVLMWRKLGSLKAIIDRPVDEDLSERHIKSTLQVYEFWRNMYGDFIQECIDKHHTLSFQVQSWYIILACHFHLASLFIADCIREIDHRGQSSTKARFLRAASALILEITKTGVGVISDIAAASLSAASSSQHAKNTHQVHPALKDAAMLLEPWTDILGEAFQKTFDVLLGWLSFWALALASTSSSSSCFSSSSYSNNEQEWLACNTSQADLVKRCSSCIDAMELLGRKSLRCFLISRKMRSQLAGVGGPGLDTRNELGAGGGIHTAVDDDDDDDWEPPSITGMIHPWTASEFGAGCL